MRVPVMARSQEDGMAFGPNFDIQQRRRCQRIRDFLFLFLFFFLSFPQVIPAIAGGKVEGWRRLDFGNPMITRDGVDGRELDFLDRFGGI